MGLLHADIGLDIDIRFLEPTVHSLDLPILLSK